MTSTTRVKHWPSLPPRWWRTLTWMSGSRQHGIRRQGSADGGSKLRCVGRDGLAFQRLPDIVQRAVGFQEEVARHLHMGQSAIVFIGRSFGIRGDDRERELFID